MKLLTNDSRELREKLERYLQSDLRYKAVFDYTRQRFEAATNLTAHNWAHAYRDTLNAIVIGEAEGADMHVVLPAITMHDIGFLYGASGEAHGDVGADQVDAFLQEAGAHYSIEDIEKIAACIRTHKGSIHGKQPDGLEAKVVADADLLEKFGPFGVYQTIRTYGEFNWPIQKAIQRGDDILTVRLETKTGESLAKQGRQFTADFYKHLAEANQPYESPNA
jgi:uncharacterized protein